MKKLSTSLILGKASNPHGANVEHNQREFLADNIDVSRIRDNMVYVQQHIRDAYDKLFGEALEEYNAKQKRADRKIHNYFDHIDIIPFYTEPRKNGLSKGVSMKAALIEMGFNPKSMKQNQLVAWEESELKVMEQILRRHGFSRDVRTCLHKVKTASKEYASEI